MSTKTKEANALAAKIEAEIKREGELGMEITEAPDDLEDTKAALGEDGEPAEVQLTWWLLDFAHPSAAKTSTFFSR